MSILTEKQIEYGYNYFHKDEPDKRCIVEKYGLLITRPELYTK